MPAPPAMEQARRFTGLKSLLPPLLLGLVTFLVYSNALHEGLIVDDKLFADYQRFADLSRIPAYFVDHVWATRYVESGLYRPMLFISIALDANLFGDAFFGYHLINILFHVLATLLLYLLLKRLLDMDARSRANAVYAAFLAALVFGVQPVNTEVVNSIFNRSVLLAAIGVFAGLWCLVTFLDSRPVTAWSGLFLAYLFALFSRETAIVLPALAATLVLFYTSGSLRERIRACLPVLILLLPMLLYLTLRSNALSGGELGYVAEGSAGGIAAQVDASRLLQPQMLVGVAGIWVQALGTFFWPFDLTLYHPRLPILWQWVGVLLHAGLLIASGLLYRRGYKAPLVGLLIFYISFLPASRLFGASGIIPHLQLRYLFLPSMGLVLILAYALAMLRQRLDPVLIAAPVVLFLLVATPITWARNAAWSDELALFEADYAEGSRAAMLLRLLTAAHLREKNFDRVIEICEASKRPDGRHGARVELHCASALSYSGRPEEAEQAYLAAAREENDRVLAYSNLAQHYLRQGRWEDAKLQFERAVGAEQDPARKAFRTGYMLVYLYPASRPKLTEARSRFAEAARLQPQWSEPPVWLSRLDEFLASGGSEAEN